jgi:CubicO group peptidase (beta-lactamase class C family)
MNSSTYINEEGEVRTSGIDMPVPWWSFTKTVLAIAALRLVEQGALTLNDPLTNERFTLAQLLRHQAGLPDYGALTQYHDDVAAHKTPWPVAQLLETMDADHLRYEPGTSWAYSNIGYLKIGHLIAQASGLPLATALDHLVFTPAQLTTAQLALTPADLRHVHMGEAQSYHPGWVYHGLVTGTTLDAARLLRALLMGKLLKPETFATMLQSHALPEFKSATHPDPAYALGLMLWAHDPLAHPLGHTGGGPGSEIAVYGKGKQVCAIWQTTPSDSDPVETQVFKALSS